MKKMQDNLRHYISHIVYSELELGQTNFAYSRPRLCKKLWLFDGLAQM